MVYSILYYWHKINLFSVDCLQEKEYGKRKKPEIL